MREAFSLYTQVKISRLQKHGNPSCNIMGNIKGEQVLLIINLTREDLVLIENKMFFRTTPYLQWTKPSFSLISRSLFMSSNT